ncbi:peptide-methionine (S)-S-oxide reductase MsrA [Candidatus Kaiserbacteria bacterium]|nr:peptide-methionine (S)-S-oxide reductase MsrA [Candidatus Kaiserbacteria bacterium]
MKRNIQRAIFAAGCFWGVEEVFRNTPGVVDTRVGYTGGLLKNPTYEDVCRGDTGHAETVEVTFDSAKVTYEKLLDVFWNLHDPTQYNRQGPDVGAQYRSAIFYLTEEQKSKAEKSKARLDASGKYHDEIVTDIAPASDFFEAEEYHQQYIAKKGGETCRV